MCTIKSEKEFNKKIAGTRPRGDVKYNRASYTARSSPLSFIQSNILQTSFVFFSRHSPSLMPKEGSADDGLIASFSKVGLNWSFHALLIDCCHRLRNKKSEFLINGFEFKGRKCLRPCKFIIIVFIFRAIFLSIFQQPPQLPR